MHLTVTREIMHEVANIADGLYLPVQGYLDRRDYRSIVDRVKLRSGETFPFPLALAVPADRDDLAPGRRVALTLAERQKPFAEIEITDRYETNPARDIPRLFKTSSPEHPGVAKEFARGSWRVGARIRRLFPAQIERSPHYRRPAEILKIKKQRRLKTLVGFQTRNAIHRAHEHLIRTGMEVFDAILIQPLVGDRKEGDFSEDAIVGSYRAFLDHYVPPERVLFATWQAAMRYAGPREALLHALVRRNFGCTHFIVGRDQAGVGAYYGKYEAQEFCHAHPIPGLTIVAMSGPFWCHRCSETVTERTCRHARESAAAVEEVSGSRIRKMLAKGTAPGSHLLRPEVSEFLLSLGSDRVFI